MDQICISQLQVFAHHGVFPEEKEQGQDFFLNIKLNLDCRKAGKSDDLKDSLDYGEVSQFAVKVFQETTFDLIEAAAEHLCQQLLCRYKGLNEVELELYKPHAPIGLPFGNVSVKMKRKWHKIYLSFGSNMGDKSAYIREGIRELQEHPAIRNLRVSELLETEPYGYLEQDTFLNGCLEAETLLMPEELLELLHEIEAHGDRKRVIVWGPRTLDLDIVFYDKEVYESDTLMIPHVDMQNRMFVLQPLSELCPNFRHPILGLTVKQMLEQVRKKEAEDTAADGV